MLTGLGLVGGLVALLFEPLATTAMNRFVGWVLLAVAVASIAFMVVAFGGPRDRGPDF